jgi:hypothetical protein
MIVDGVLKIDLDPAFFGGAGTTKIVIKGGMVSPADHATTHESGARTRSRTRT